MHGKQKFESQVLTFTSAVQFQVSCCCSSTFLSRCLPSSQGRQEQKENYWKPIFLFRELSKPLNPEQTFSIKHHQKGKGTFVWFLLGLKMLFAALYADAEPLHLRGTSKPFKVKQRRISHQSAASVKTCTSVPVESLKVCDIPASESSDQCKHTQQQSRTSLQPNSQVCWDLPLKELLVDSHHTVSPSSSSRRLRLFCQLEERTFTMLEPRIITWTSSLSWIPGAWRQSSRRRKRYPKGKHSNFGEQLFISTFRCFSFLVLFHFF